jgi:hypothetical protein
LEAGPGVAPAIVLRFWREPWFVAWALLVLGMGLFVERAFCRYLCPLGAALALPARLRQFEWLKRHRQCGVECRICQVQCPVGAIQPEGPISWYHHRPLLRRSTSKKLFMVVSSQRHRHATRPRPSDTFVKVPLLVLFPSMIRYAAILILVSQRS